MTRYRVQILETNVYEVMVDAESDAAAANLASAVFQFSPQLREQGHVESIVTKVIPPDARESMSRAKDDITGEDPASCPTSALSFTNEMSD